MAQHGHLVHLDALEEEGLSGDEVALGAVLGDALDEVGVVGLGHLHPREEIREDRVEELRGFL